MLDAMVWFLTAQLQPKFTLRLRRAGQTHQVALNVTAVRKFDLHNKRGGPHTVTAHLGSGWALYLPRYLDYCNINMVLVEEMPLARLGSDQHLRRIVLGMAGDTYESYEQIVALKDAVNPAACHEQHCTCI